MPSRVIITSAVIYSREWITEIRLAYIQVVPLVFVCYRNYGHVEMGSYAISFRYIYVYRWFENDYIFWNDWACPLLIYALVVLIDSRLCTLGTNYNYFDTMRLSSSSISKNLLVTGRRVDVQTSFTILHRIHSRRLLQLSEAIEIRRIKSQLCKQ